MFKNEYQGGPFVEIFSAQGKNPGTNWKVFGSPSVIGKEFDKEVKGFVFVLEGSSQTNKMQLPKETRQNLGLIQQFLVLQIYVPLGKDFSTELLITDLRNIKRRLYLSTIHKELSVTPLHAKIPLFMIKRKIWCNLCIDLVAFTSGIFKGAVFQSLDGIVISANCKLRKIFTLKSVPLDTADQDDEWLFPDKESSQLDSSNITLMTCETSYSFLTSGLNDDQAHENKQAVEDHHEDIFTYSSKPRSAPHGKPLNLSLEGCSFPVDLRENISGRGAQMEDDFYGNESNEDESYSELTQEAQNLHTSCFIAGSSEPVISKEIPRKMTCRSPENWANRGFAKQASEESLAPRPEDLTGMMEMTDNIQGNLLSTSCLCPTGSVTQSCKETSGTSTSISRKSLKEIPWENSNKIISIPEYDCRNYQPDNVSASELEMLASMKRQQNEELEDNGPSRDLSASQIDNCNISISTSSDDTTTWNSCLPVPVNQGCHYQKEMNPLSHSNPRDWVNVFSPPIISPSQTLAEHAESTADLSTQGEVDFGAEEDEVLTLLYDPCLNCYFDPETGKYYELA
ncbi:protein CFAP20DC isoform X4 [Varanus komodoensis]|uniref:protein CFAP20DC isoform X4 n=1 Tax=Varanus komodoensis TaxID=61221 RepID=UPI001CF7C1D1|nr:protein CFAP20DC isoform X4 [Varanus komodoensis]